MQESATASIDEEIKRLQYVLAGKEEEYKWEKMIADLKAKGVEGAEAKVGQLRALTAEAEAVEALKSQYESLASGIAGEMTGAFRSIIDGSKSAEEAMADMFKGIADKFLDMAMKILQDAIVQQLMQLIPALFGGFSGGIGGGGGFGGAPQLSNIPFSAGGISYEGGGYTGNGSRVGGVDGRGGFPAILHPNETVVDHTRYGPGNEGTNSFMRPAQTSFNLQTTVINGVEYATVDQVREMGLQATRDGAKQGEARTLNALRNKRSSRARAGV